MIEATSGSAPEREERAPWGLREIVTVFGITVIALVVVFTALSLLVRALGIEGNLSDDPVGLAVLLAGQMVLDVIAVGLAAAFSLGKYGLRPSAWGLLWPPRLNVGLIVGVLVLCYTALIGYALIVTSLGLEALEPESNVPEGFFDFPRVVPLAVFLVVVVAPMAEEMFFRGFVFHGLWSRFGFWPAAVASGFVFAMIHVTGAEALGLIVPFTIIGTLFAWLAGSTGSLWNAIAVHFLFNSISIAVNLAQRIL
jgi:membrane protease YdiL (CAAX protease family)